MSRHVENNKLSRGLSVLLGEATLDEGNSVNSLTHIEIEKIKPGHYQPRVFFDNESLAQLVDSIREKGLIQPILVRPHGDGYEIIAGERRWRAAQLANLRVIPVIIREYNDNEALEIALIENIQREDLNVIEEAMAYKRLMEQFSYTQEKVAKSVGKSRSHVANILRLLTLPDKVKDLLKNNKITAGHAKVLIGLANYEELVEKILEDNLNVRETERLVRKIRKGGAEGKSTELVEIEQKLASIFRLHTTLWVDSSKGKITVNFSSLEELDELLDRLSILT